ncbi:UreF-domain-containing protein [Xylariaceae sp. FL0255]|nr:UreF-domain-containing protein [Xylariaceae sp. FL0255]
MDQAPPLGGEVDDESDLQNEIAELEAQLANAKQRLIASQGRGSPTSQQERLSSHPALLSWPAPAVPDSSHHYLLLLSDSALPLGSFAFSSGLESYLAHSKPPPAPPSPSSPSSQQQRLLYKPSFASFLPLSLSSYASTTLPFVLAAHRDPSFESLRDLDDALDASIICAVGRRASVSQGRALLSIWEKSLRPPGSSSLSSSPLASSSEDKESRQALVDFSTLLRHSSSQQQSKKPKGDDDDEDDPLPPPISAHLPPLFGAISRFLGLTAHQTAYVFLLSHAKALVSAAVRASMFGPYQAQRILASGDTRTLISDLVTREWDVPFEMAGQSVPVMDLWIGRHEMLYSRIFNS